MLRIITCSVICVFFISGFVVLIHLGMQGRAADIQVALVLHDPHWADWDWVPIVLMPCAPLGFALIWGARAIWAIQVYSRARGERKG